MKSNVKAKAVPVFTHEGGKAQRTTPYLELQRTVGTCLLFENTFYEKGNDIADRIIDLCKKVKASEIFDLAIYAREELKLRHVPLFLTLQYIANARGNPAARELISRVIKRPDEMGELISLYWKDGKKPLPAQMKKGLAARFKDFKQFQLAKWNSANASIRVRDVMFMVHPKPIGPEQEKLFKMVAEDTLPIPVTWETELSAGKDKQQTWTTLLREGKLGIMAFLMNLRNMDKVKVDHQIITDAFAKVDKAVALPFRYVTACRYNPWFGQQLDQGFLESLKHIPALSGKTYIIVDTSGSMFDTLSSKGETTRLDAAGGMAALVKGLVPQSRVFWFDTSWGEIASNITGLALAADISRRGGGGTYLDQAVTGILAKNGYPERIIVVTDEQSHDNFSPLPPDVRGYLINLAPYKHGVSTAGGWVRVSGFSERILDWIRLEETFDER